MVVTNLPRSERFKTENVILVGIIFEPPLHMNSYLRPLVDELIKLWCEGIQVHSPDHPHPITLKAVLHVIFLLAGRSFGSVDTPPKWVVRSVQNHFNKKMNFGGFIECTMRNEHDHQQQAYLAREQNSASATLL